MNDLARFWLTSKTCVRHSRISSGVAVLLRHLNDWLRDRREPPVTATELVEYLREQGLEVREVAGTLLVFGFGLREDLMACRDLIV